MGIHYFTDEQVIELSKNPNVKHVSNKSITYQESFKEHYLEAYSQGKTARAIFIEAGFNVEVLGDSRIKSSCKRWRKQSKRLEGVKDTRKGGSGRPITKDLTKDEIIERQKAQIEYLKQERDFLLELKRLERRAIKKQKLSPKKSLKSSKQ
jgi:transposase